MAGTRDWTCDSCAWGGTEEVRCVLCPERGGLMKRTTDWRYVDKNGCKFLFVSSHSTVHSHLVRPRLHISMSAIALRTVACIRMSIQMLRCRKVAPLRAHSAHPGLVVRACSCSVAQLGALVVCALDSRSIFSVRRGPRAGRLLSSEWQAVQEALCVLRELRGCVCRLHRAAVQSRVPHHVRHQAQCVPRVSREQCGRRRRPGDFVVRHACQEVERPQGGQGQAMSAGCVDCLRSEYMIQ